MAQRFTSLAPELIAFVRRQHVFFVASAALDARVNVSPKPASALRVVSPTCVAYLDETGSGNETAAHVHAGGRVTIMLCAFEGPPRILRLYGKGRIVHRGSSAYEDLLAQSFDGSETPGARQIVVLDVDLVQTSCGYGVPFFAYEGERTTLTAWAERKGPTALEDYRREKNVESLDGLPTGLDTQRA